MSTKLYLATLFTVFCMAANATPPIEDGKAIFTARCAACHNVNKQMTGPALAGVHERRSMDWIINFVHSSQSMVKKGDKDAVALFQKFNNIPMPDHPDLTEAHIRSIVEFVKSETKAVNEEIPFAKPEKIRPNYTPISLTSYSFFIGFLGSIGVLILVLLFAVEVSELRRKKIDNNS